MMSIVRLMYSIVKSRFNFCKSPEVFLVKKGNYSIFWVYAFKLFLRVTLTDIAEFV